MTYFWPVRFKWKCGGRGLGKNLKEKEFFPFLLAGMLVKWWELKQPFWSVRKLTMVGNAVRQKRPGP